MSYLEIYNENIRDLLSPDSGHLDLRDDRGGRNARVAGLTETEASSTKEVKAKEAGKVHRTTHRVELLLYAWLSSTVVRDLNFYTTE